MLGDRRMGTFAMNGAGKNVAVRGLCYVIG